MIDSGETKPKKQKAREIENYANIPHPELYNLLRSWRNEKAIEQSIPAYMIFAQKALVELVTYLPVNLSELQKINGLGKRKIDRYGKDIAALIREYCEEHEIDKGEIPLKDEPKKKKEPKPDTKKVSLKMFLSGKTVTEIAKERGYTENTIEGHLAHFVRTGELDVFQFLSKEKLEKIAAYFKNTKERNLTPAREALGNEFSYGDLRIGLSYLESRKD
ncbi:helix-turn-helix domain-containing protein [Maribellus sp. YY47]|nr:helix-turn-helix domain-containing protein [Maribellus sp. YY47]